MSILAYPDCCAFKIHMDNYLDNRALSKFKDICNAVRSNTEVSGTYIASSTVNNRVLLALNINQLRFIEGLRAYIKDNNISITVKKLTDFINPKTNNRVYLYMVYRRGPTTKKSARRGR